MKQGAIFDMDGLLLDTEKLYKDSWEITAKEFGIEHNQDFPRAVCGTSGESMAEVVKKYYPMVNTQDFIAGCISHVEASLEKSIPEKPGIREILKYFHKEGVKIAVASSSKKEMIENNLKRIGILKYFDAVVSGQQVKVGKPDPAIFLLAAAQIGCESRDCYVFEDGRNGVYAGVAAGCATIMIPDLTPPDEELRTICTGIYPSLLEALEAIKAGKL